MEEKSKIVAKAIVETLYNLSKDIRMTSLAFNSDFGNKDRTTSYTRIIALYRSVPMDYEEKHSLVCTPKVCIDLLQCHENVLRSIFDSNKDICDKRELIDIYYGREIYDPQDELSKFKDKMVTDLGVSNLKYYYERFHNKKDILFQKLIYDQIINLRKREIPVITNSTTLQQNGCINCKTNYYKYAQDLTKAVRSKCPNCGTLYLLDTYDVLKDMSDKAKTYRMYFKNQDGIIDSPINMLKQESLEDELKNKLVKVKVR